MVRLGIALPLSLPLLLLCACSAPPQNKGLPWQQVSDASQELGTSYHVILEIDSKNHDPATARQDLADLRQRCRQLERRFSEWQEGSEIARINQQAANRAIPLAADMRQLLSGALNVSRATDGAFDITWPSPATTWQHVQIVEEGIRFLHPKTKLGIAGVAKGWIIDSLFHDLQTKGYQNIVVNIGGDLRTSGKRQSIRVASPYDMQETVCHITVQNRSMATSGNYIRKGHILDPRSGKAPAFDGSVTALTQDAAMADAMATALFVMGPDAGMIFAAKTEGLDVLYANREGIRSTLSKKALSGRD